MNWRRLIDKFLGRFYEGPEPPTRLSYDVRSFANANPHATRASWEEFADSHARRAYREGYIRGVEYVERDTEQWWPDVDPEIIADEYDPLWRDSDPFELRDREVTEEFDETQHLQDELDTVILEESYSIRNPLLRDAKRGVQ